MPAARASSSAAPEYDARYAELLPAFDDECKAEGDKVRELGGLYVLGTERHESRRIDNQLRGRSGRQGDPGESRFYLSLEDELMRLFATGLMSRVMDASFPDDMPLESKMVSKAVERAQGTVEDRNFEIRKNVLKYDEVMNEQRKVIYKRRQQILDGEDLRERGGRGDRVRDQPARRPVLPRRVRRGVGRPTVCSTPRKTYFPTRITKEQTRRASIGARSARGAVPRRRARRCTTRRRRRSAPRRCATSSGA